MLSDVFSIDFNNAFKYNESAKPCSKNVVARFAKYE